MANAYAEFVRQNIHQFKHLPPKQRMVECAKLYHQMKGSQPMPKKMAKKGKAKKGGSFLGSILPFGNLLGLGLDTQHPQGGYMPQGGAVPEGGSFLGSILPFGNLLGLGLDTKKKGRGKKMPAKRVRKPRGGTMVTPTMTASGGNFLDDFVTGFKMPFEALGHVLPLVKHLL